MSQTAAIADWLGNEIKIVASEQDDHVPLGGRITLVYDSTDDILPCLRSANTRPTQQVARAIGPRLVQ